jgi:hypothetical protein
MWAFDSKRVLATLWKIYCRVSTGYWQPSEKFFRGYWQLMRMAHTIFATGLPILFLGQILITLQIDCQWVLDSLYRRLQELCPINKERGNLYAIHLNKLKVKIKIQEATHSFKYCKRFIYLLGSVDLCHCSSSQSGETVPLICKSDAQRKSRNK